MHTLSRVRKGTGSLAGGIGGVSSDAIGTCASDYVVGAQHEIHFVGRPAKFNRSNTCFLILFHLIEAWRRRVPRVALSPNPREGDLNPPPPRCDATVLARQPFSIDEGCETLPVGPRLESVPAAPAVFMTSRVVFGLNAASKRTPSELHPFGPVCFERSDLGLGGPSS